MSLPSDLSKTLSPDASRRDRLVFRRQKNLFKQLNKAIHAAGCATGKLEVLVSETPTQVFYASTLSCDCAICQSFGVFANEICGFFPEYLEGKKVCTCPDCLPTSGTVH